MVQLRHFSHRHRLDLVNLQPNHIYEEEEEEEEEEEKDVDDFVVEDHQVGQCNMCKEQIYSFHFCYYNCKSCDYSLHNFCAEMPTILFDHPLHPNHNLSSCKGIPYRSYEKWACGVCNRKWKDVFTYHCVICTFDMDIICATMFQQTIDHPSHHHQLQRYPKKLVSSCNACGREHEGTFYHCTTCYWFSIHQDCALMPAKLLIQNPTNHTLTHSHSLTLTYSFPYIDKKAKFNPKCRICDRGFLINFWLYKCDKCRYYVHIHCATSKFVDFLRPGRGKMYKNFKDDEHPNLLRCPFPDESYNLVKHHFFNNDKDFILEKSHGDGETFQHFSHQHPLIFLDTQTSLDNNSVLLHNPMKKVQLLCDVCVKPITEMPFYKCLEEDCGFVRHEWCARLPSEVEDHPGHPNHTLFLMPNVNGELLGVFNCGICKLPSNGFAYGCRTCNNYYLDVNCAFLPEEITHEAHPDHLLSRITEASSGLSKTTCNACGVSTLNHIAFHCDSCDFSLDTRCAFLSPRMIRHKYDKHHPLSLRYEPTENHPGDYFCEICEDKFNPDSWFYHCSFCAQSMHPACAPVILQSEQAIYAEFSRYLLVFGYINVKFGGMLEIKGHPHRLTYAQGMKCHGQCNQCHKMLQYDMIFICFECSYVLDYDCAELLQIT